MEIEVYTRELKKIGDLGTIDVLKWNRRYYTNGTFIIKCAATDTNRYLLSEGNVIYRKDTGEAAYVTYRNPSHDSEGNESFIVQGKSLSFYLNRRINWSTLNFTGTVEELYRTLVNNNAILRAPLPKLELGELHGYTETITMQDSYSNLHELLCKLAQQTDISFRIILDRDNLVYKFDVYKGLDCTENQSVNKKVVFCKENSNVLTENYIESDEDYRNTALILGCGEGKDRKSASIIQGEGFDRYEYPVDARDISDTKQIIAQDGSTTEEKISDSDYNKLLLQRGQSKLGEHKKTELFDSVVNANQTNFVLRRDYDVGYLVTCKNTDWNVKKDTRISGSDEVYQNSQSDTSIIFGNDNLVEGSV